MYPNIITEMERHNITVEELSCRLGLSVDAVNHKLNGKREFTLAEIEGIANVFSCSLDYLVGHEPRSARVGIGTSLVKPTGSD